MKEVQKLTKNNLDKSYTGNYENHIACSYGYKLNCADDRFSKPVQIQWGGNTIYKFVSKMLEEVKYYK